jgi:hypothetical protein
MATSPAKCHFNYLGHNVTYKCNNDKRSKVHNKDESLKGYFTV